MVDEIQLNEYQFVNMLLAHARSAWHPQGPNHATHGHDGCGDWCYEVFHVAANYLRTRQEMSTAGGHFMYTFTRPDGTTSPAFHHTNSSKGDRFCLSPNGSIEWWQVEPSAPGKYKLVFTF